jgi:hypothetical protein
MVAPDARPLLPTALPAAPAAFYYSHGSSENTFIIAGKANSLPIALGALSAEDTTYILSTVEKSFDDAEAYCAAHGGHLASWGADAEQKSVEDYFQKTTGYMMQGFFSFYWFGLRVGFDSPASSRGRGRPAACADVLHLLRPAGPGVAQLRVGRPGDAAQLQELGGRPARRPVLCRRRQRASPLQRLVLVRPGLQGACHLHVRGPA